MGALADANPADKARMYSQLDLALSCHTGSQTTRAEAGPP